jgi:hypothetical protein
MPIAFPLIAEGANWCRLLAYETGAVAGVLETRWTGVGR